MLAKTLSHNDSGAASMLACLQIDRIAGEQRDGWSMLRLIADNAVDLLSVHNDRHQFLFASRNALRLFGWTAIDLCGRSLFAFLHAGDARRVAAEFGNFREGREICVRYRFRCRSGDHRWVESRAQIDECGHMVAITRDIHDEMDRVQALERAASYDTLTKLLNRRATELMLHAELQRSRRHALAFSVAFFDVDRFKQINDTQGHLAGDQILQKIGGSISANKRLYDVLGRWGGDEFVMMFPNTNATSAAATVRRIRDRIARELRGVTMSFGISDNTDAESIDDMLSRADSALYEGKRQGGNRVLVWQPRKRVRTKFGSVCHATETCD